MAARQGDDHTPVSLDSQVAFSRRRFLGMGLSAAAGVALAGCGSQGSGSAGGEVSVLHDFEYLGKPGSMVEYWRTVFSRFEKETGASVKDVNVAYADLLPRLQSFHSARSGPVIETYYSNYNTFQFVFQKVLEPLDSYIPKTEMDHWLNKCRTFDGKQYFAPWVFENAVLAANRKVCEEANVSLEDRFDSWDDFAEALQKLKQSGSTPFVVGNADKIQVGLLIDAFTMEVLEDPIQTSEVLVGDHPLGSPVGRNWMDRLSQCVEQGWINKDAPNLQYADAVARFKEGDAGFMYMFAGDASRLPKDYEIVPLWKGAGPLSAPMAAAADGLVMTNYGENKSTAAELVKFIHRPEQLTLLHDVTGEIPCDDRFKLNSPAPKQQRIFELLNSDPAPYWPSEYVPSDIVVSGFTVYGGNALRGTTGNALFEQYGQYLEQWRKQNPPIVQTLKAFIAAVKR